MNIKDNIKEEVLSIVADKANVTEDLLIQMVSSDLHNSAIVTLSIVLGLLILAIFSGFIAYFQFKKSDGSDDHEFFGTAFSVVCGISLFVAFLMFVFTGAFYDYIEILFNNDYAVVKEINEMYEEIVNPVQGNENQ